MTRLLLPLRAMPPVISDSIRVCLHAHGLSLSDEVLHELGNNVAQALMSIDESDARCSCGWSGSIEDADSHACRFEDEDRFEEEPAPLPAPGQGPCLNCGHGSLVHGRASCHYHAGDPGEETPTGGPCRCAGYVRRPSDGPIGVESRR